MGFEDMKRIVILGAGGFVGKAMVSSLTRAGFDADSISRNHIDLSDPAAAPKLANRLEGAMSVIFASAITPDFARKSGQDPTEKNVTMAKTLIECQSVVKDLHVIYLSSDAVYGVRDGVFDEEVTPEPSDAYGTMHLTRERLLAETWPDSTAIVRLSQVYGPDDTHNAYGPCRFARQALAGQPIEMFGDGEDGRDHIYISDVTNAILAIAETRYTGRICVSSGRSPTFQSITEEIAKHLPEVEIAKKPRSVPAIVKRFNTNRLQALGITPLSIEQGIPLLLDGLRT